MLQHTIITMLSIWEYSREKRSILKNENKYIILLKKFAEIS